MTNTQRPCDTRPHDQEFRLPDAGILLTARFLDQCLATLLVSPEPLLAGPVGCSSGSHIAGH